MPGFSRAMLPALKLDYTVIGARVDRLAGLLERAEGCAMDFAAAGRQHHLHLDLRHRPAHASAGVFPTAGVAGNLPSGESYIVPYEGERAGDPSRTEGELPVQFGADIVVYEVRANRAVAVLTDNAASRAEAKNLAEEPAYGNIAELGLGVLGDFGLEPTGEILLDEKLGVHIAFGRSEHFGGQVGPGSFSSPDKVVHIDRVYIEALQPQVRIERAVLEFAGGEELLLMADNRYCIEF
jgi:leucyl aminopeptidase (aminopeptidase T)